MLKFQLSHESTPGSGTYNPVEVFEGDQMGAITRVMQLQATTNGSYMIEPYTAPAEPVEAPSTDTAASH